MPKSKHRDNPQGNVLVFSVALIWLVVFILLSGVMLVAASGMIDTSEFFATLPPIPTVSTLPPAPTKAGPTPEPAPVTEESVPAPTRRAANSGGGVVFEATFTPGVIFTPTPTIFLTKPTFSEGPIVIGQSPGNHPLEVYRFGTGPVKRMIIAGIHGGYEWNTVALADELIAHLNDHPEFIPSTVTLYIVRNLNPDGLARAIGVDGRANNNKVDLNRNFPENWLAEWPRQGCWSFRPLSGGTGPGSEPETQIIMSFVEQIHPTAIISYHSAALGIFPGGEPADPDSVRLAQTLADASDYPYPPIETGCLFSGTLPDWAVSIGIAAVDLELHNHTHTDFEENLRVLEAFLKWRK